jgi:EmrB/QacA subfamily drug resistance transporter
MASIGKESRGSTVNAPTAPSALCAREARPWILAATILGSSLDFIDGTVVNVALPALQSQMGATILDVQWVVEAYALFLAALLLIGGALADRYGRKRIYALGIGMFALASIWCGLSPDIHQLIVARGVQGIGAALLVPGSLAIISASFPEEERGHAIGIWSGFTAISAAFGPVLGGYLIEHVSWRAIFFLNIPLAVIVLFLVYRYVPESKDDRGGRLDVWGAVLATLALGAIVYGLIESGSLGLEHPAVLTALVAGVTLLLIFFLVEMRIANPMLPLALFQSRKFVGANALTLFLYAALGGSLFFFPLNLIQVQGYSATAAGASLLPFVVIMFVLSRWSGGLIDRVGSRLPLVVGPVIAAAGFALFMMPDIGGNYWETFFPAVVVLGLGMSVTVAPLTTTVMNAVAKDHSGIASGINNAVATTASLLAVAAFGLVVSHAFNASLDRRLANANVPAEIAREFNQQRIKVTGMEIPASADSATQTVLKRAVAESFVAGFRLVMLIASVLALLSALSAWFLFRGEKTGDDASQAN